MVTIDSIAQSVYDKILNVYQHGFKMRDAKRDPTTDPEKGRVFEFPFIKGNEYTAVSVSISDGTEQKKDDREIKIIYYEDINKYMTPEQKKIWNQFRLSIKKLAVSNMYGYKDQNISSPPFTLRDDEPRAMVESLTGTRRSSYQDLGPVRIIARHKTVINPEQRGARSRNIEKLFIENSLGERYLCPEGTTLNGARAYARHVKNGGSLHDDLGQHIGKMINEMNQLRFFVRNMRGKVFEDQDTQLMVEAAINHYGNLHRTLFSLRGQRGYEQYTNLWHPEQVDEETIDVNELKERFSRKVFDDRLTVALPVVDRVYKQAKQKKQEELTEFEQWAEEVTEQLENPVNPADEENKEHISSKENVELEEEAPDVFDSEDIDPKLEKILHDNGFDYHFKDGTIYFNSHEELNRAKDFFAEADPGMHFPEMKVQDYEYGIYGSSTNDREINNSGVHESANQDNDVKDLSFLKHLAGLAK